MPNDDRATFRQEMTDIGAYVYPTQCKPCQLGKCDECEFFNYRNPFNQFCDCLCESERE